MKNATAVILGGGVTGLSTAYHLARKGYGKVILIDKGPVGDGSSSRAAGIITGLMWSETGVLARKISRRLFDELSEELDGYTFQAVGALNIFDPATWPEREKLLALYQRCDVPYEVMDADEMRKRWPDMQPPDEFIGLYDPLGGYSEPDEYVPALAQRCRELGVEIRENELVTELILRNGRAAGVRTINGAIEADAIVSTLYAWTNVLLAQSGIRLPVKSVVHQRFVTEQLAKPLAIPAVNANPLNGYIRPAAGGRLLVGIETTERDEQPVTDLKYHLSELELNSDARYSLHALKEASRTSFKDYVPALEGVNWESSRVGLLTFSMDGEPIIGPLQQLPGLYVGVAFHSGGFAYNPVSGLLLAEFVAEERSSIDLSLFSPDRFDKDETKAYLAKTVQQKNVARRRH